MKIYCDKCNGHGNHGYVMEFEGDEGFAIKCLDCDGKGYTENEELHRLADIGRATEHIFFRGGWVQMMHIKDIDTTDDLMEWYERQNK